MSAIKLDPVAIRKGIKKVLKKMFQPKKETQPQWALQPIRPERRF